MSSQKPSTSVFSCEYRARLPGSLWICRSMTAMRSFLVTNPILAMTSEFRTSETNSTVDSSGYMKGKSISAKRKAAATATPATRKSEGPPPVESGALPVARVESRLRSSLLLCGRPSERGLRGAQRLCGTTSQLSQSAQSVGTTNWHNKGRLLCG